MSNWIKNKLLERFSKAEIELSRQIVYAQSVLDSSSYPDDVKAAVSDILIGKNKKMNRIISLKKYFA